MKRKEQISSGKSTLIRLLKYGTIDRSLLGYIVGVVIVLFGNTGAEMAMARLLQTMFDALAAGSLSALLAAIKVGSLIILGFAVIFPVGLYLLGASAARITANLRSAVYGHVQRLPIAFFKSAHSGDLTSRLTNDISQAEQAYVTHIFNLALSICVGIASTVYLFMLDWRLFLYAIAIGLLGLFINSKFARPLRVIGQQVQQRLGSLNETLTDILAGMHIIRSFCLGDIFLSKFRSKNTEVYDSSMERIQKRATLNVLNEVLMTLSGMGLFGLGAWLALQGNIGFGAIIASVQLSNYTDRMFRSLGNFITNIQASLAAADRLFEVVDIEPEPVQYKLSPARSHKNYIAFEDVVFSYDDNELVLNGLSFAANKNEAVALVGPSGGGKSTVLKLLLGFYRAQGGSITINGAPFESMSLKEIRNTTAYVPQDAYLFAGTIADNIRYGREEATMDEIIAAAKVANAHDFIEAFEKGYDTPVGERGTQLSGGQRQRIAIARAVLKDAPILLLDEATSALDSESEQLVQDALNKLMVGRTTLVIAHRLSTIQHADKIVVVENGQVAEEGTHQDLLDLNGVYRGLYDQQFKSSETAPQTQAVSAS